MSSALQRLSMVDRIEVMRDGPLHVRLKKIAMLGQQCVAWGYHRLVIEPGSDEDAILDAVSNHLDAMKAGRPDRDEEWGRVRRVTALFQTSKVIEAFRERRARALKGEDPDAELDGIVSFRVIAAQRATPACPADRIDGMVLAKPVLFLAGFEPRDVGATLQAAPGADIEADAPEFDKALRAAVGAAPEREDWHRIGKLAKAEHTPERVAAYRERAAKRAPKTRRTAAKEP